jgi:hypothetical protein
MEVALHAAGCATDPFELHERTHADGTILERKCVAVVRFGADTVESERLAGNLESRYLLVTVAMHEDSLERADAHGIEAVDGVVGVKQGFAATPAHCRIDDSVELLQFNGREICWQANPA